MDSSGNLWVADEGNGRVLRFPSPFQQTGSGPQQANLVVGQLDFTTTLTGATPQTMGAQAGIAFTKSGGLLVSDALFNRVKPRRDGSSPTAGASLSSPRAATLRLTIEISLALAEKSRTCDLTPQNANSI